MWGSSHREVLLRFRRRQWTQLIEELGRRGAGHSEAGAFLLADRDRPEHLVTRVVYLNDLDPDCLQGSIRFNGLAYSALWDICESERRVVVGDIHTHPGAGVRQSSTDSENPMVSRKGHVAIIVPHLATRPVKPAEAGVHQYRGTDGWITWTAADAARRLQVRRWR
jgi:hypothetical protein